TYKNIRMARPRNPTMRANVRCIVLSCCMRDDDVLPSAPSPYAVAGSGELRTPGVWQRAIIHHALRVMRVIARRMSASTTFMDHTSAFIHLGLRTQYYPSQVVQVPFGMRPEDLRTHLYVVGRTGTGKSTLLKSMVSQAIALGMGVGVLDPHGTLI